MLEGIPALLTALKENENITSFYLFGSVVKGYLNPLSDLDLAVLLDKNVSRKKFFDEYLKIFEIVNNILNLDEFYLIILNRVPPGFAYNIFR